MEEKKVPALRFRGFDNAWEQRRLGEVATITMGQSPDGATYSDSPSKYILVQGNADLKDGWVFPRVWTTQKTKVCDKGDLIMSVRAPAGAMGKTAYNAVIGRGVAAIKGNEFIYQRLVKMDLCDYWKKLAAGSTFESINSDIIFNAEIAMPSGKEQKKIGSIFNKLDHLISLHQRKLEMLKKVKKSMLEKMFPKNDAKVPEVRFSDFTDAWEQRRLGELADKVTEKNTLLAKTEVLTNSAEFGIINQREFFDHDIVNENNIGGYYIVRERDFVYNPRISVSAPVGPINCNKLGKSGVMSPLYTVFRVHDIDSVYLEYFFKTSRWHSFMRFNGDSGVRSDRFSIKTELFYKMPIPITKYCEQVKIGKYFSQLDHLISLHQRKLEKLKNIKKSMLEKMFII